MVLGFIKKAGSFLARKAGRLAKRVAEDPIGAFSAGAKLLTGVDPKEDIEKIVGAGKKAFTGLGGVVSGARDIARGRPGKGIQDIVEGGGMLVGGAGEALGRGQALAGRLAKGLVEN